MYTKNEVSGGRSMSEYKPVKFKRKKRLDPGFIRILAFRIIPIILVIVISVCGFSIFDKKISEIIANQKYENLADRGVIDDPSSTDYSANVAGWAEADPNGFDPLSLSPLGLTNGLRPSSTAGTTEFERALGYSNKQSKIWSIHDSINRDILAWVYMYGMGINYPVAEDINNTDYYLAHSYDKTKSTSGTLFMSSVCSINPLSKNMIIHGHNMRDGTMFATLNNYLKGTREFYEAHKYIFFDTLYGTYRYEIYSVYKTDPQDIYLTTAFGSNASFLNWCEETNSRGIFKNASTTFTAADRILTLSTCDASAKHRIVVHAKMIYPVPKDDIEFVYDETNNTNNTNNNDDVTVTPSPAPEQHDTPPVVTPAPIPFAPGTPYRVKLSDEKSTLRLRSAPNLTSNIQAGLAHGTQVTIIASVDDTWVQVHTEGGMDGYLQKRMLVPENEFSYTIPNTNVTAPNTNIVA